MATEVFPWRETPPGDFAVIGDPIAHSKSPAMHDAAYRALGLDLTYRAIHVPVGEVAQALDHLREIGYRGVNVTIPDKEGALAWALESDHVAREAGGANTLALRTRAATNTDGFGFRWSVMGDSAGPGRVLLLGAGGTAATVVLRTMERSQLSIWNRNPERAHRLLREMDARLEPAPPAIITDRHGNPVPGTPATPEEHLFRRRARLAEVRVLDTPDLRGYDLIVNATPASLRGEDLGLDWSQAEPTATAYDLAYGVDQAPFLRCAREASLKTLDGRDMLAMQGALAFTWWGLTRVDPASVGSGKWETLPKGSEPLIGLKDLGAVMRGALD